MFEKYFVTCPVAVALRGAGFDEPCMGYHQTDSTKTQSKHFYSAEPADIIYNSSLSAHHYAAPLYQQVFEWLEAKGLYLHDYRITKNVNRISKKTVYGTSVFDDEGMQLWPIITNIGDMDVFIKHSHDTLQLAWDQAILAAIKLLPNESQMDV